MKPGHASRTAEHMAFFRALESATPARARCRDPLARAFLRPSLAWVASAARLPGVASWTARFIDRRWPGARTSAVARTRLLDEAVGEGIAAGAQQLVILGAGFDSRAYRLPALRDTRVFEVDHPSTQQRKRAALLRALGALPEGVRFVATDFDERGLDQAMAAAGYQPSRKSVFLWEGVTNYLRADAVDATLRWCARAAPGSQLLFTYVHADVLARPASFVGTERLFATLAAAGESWTFGLDPAQLAGYLAARGLVLQRDLEAAEYRRLAYGDAAERMQGYEFYHIAVARVADPIVPRAPTPA